MPLLLSRHEPSFTATRGGPLSLRKSNNTKIAPVTALIKTTNRLLVPSKHAVVEPIDELLELDTRLTLPSLSKHQFLRHAIR